MLHLKNDTRGFMEKYAWSAKIKDGKKDEYIRRHNEIYPMLVKVFTLD